jgi:hypothetical protein
VLAGTTPTESVFWLANAEGPASQVASESSYRCPENIFGLAIVEAERELIQVEWQVLFAHVVIRADYAALQEAPEGFQILGVDVAAHVLAAHMINRRVREQAIQVLVSDVSVGRDQTDFLVNRLSHESFQRAGFGVLDNLTNNISLPTDRADDANLAGADPASAAMLALVRVFVSFLAADECFIDFDDPHELPKLWIGKSSAKPMTDKPRGPVRTGTDHPVDLECADSLFTRQHQVENLEPDQQLVIRILENRVDGYREPIRRALGFPAVGALPMKGTRLTRVHLVVPAARASDAVRPTLIAEIRLAGILIGKHPVESGKGQLADKLRFVFCLIIAAHETNIAASLVLVKGCIITLI